MSRLNHRSSRRLGLESLENRLLMAGNLTVVPTVAGGLDVTGGGQDNEVQISQPLMQDGTPFKGRYVVTGLNGTTINGAAEQTFNNIVGDFRIFLNGGDDRLTMGNGGSVNNFIVPRSLIISTDFGNDSVALNGISVRDDVTINTGDGNDSVGFMASVGALAGIDNGANDLQINTAEGDDSVTVLAGYVRRNLSIDTGTGHDSVNLQNLSVGAVAAIHTGEGDDTVRLAVNVNVNNELTINTYGGRDKVTINDLAVDQLFVYLGDDADEITLKNSSGRRARMEGQGGRDSLFESDNNFTNPIQRIQESLFGF